MKVLNNRLIVKEHLNTSEVDTKAGKLYVDTSFDGYRHTNRIVEVVAVPNKVTFDKNKSPFRQSAATSKQSDFEPEWKTEMELQVGDIAWVHPFALNSENKNTGTFDIDGSKHFVIDYAMVIVAKREEQVICCNGYVLLKRIVKENKHKGIVIPSANFKQIESILITSGEDYHDEAAELLKGYEEQEEYINCIVEYAGVPNKEYKTRGYIDNEMIETGSNVYFKSKYSGSKLLVSYLEAEEHAQFNGKEMYIVKQRKDLNLRLTATSN